MELWIFIGLIFILGEIIFTNLVLVWFAISAFIVAILYNIIPSGLIQVILFGIISILLTVLATKKMIKNDKSYVSNTNLKWIESQVGIVNNEILPNEWGSVYIGGEEWSALSSDDNVLHQGDKVSVLKIEGVKLIVKKYLKEDKKCLV